MTVSKAALRHEPGPADGRQVAAAPVRVLVADDERSMRELLAIVLKREGYDVVLAENGGAALAVLKQGHVDLLISDIRLPGENGYALLQRIRALPAEEGGFTPAIALTVNVRTEDWESALRAGFDMHVPKPIEEAELLAVLAAATRRLRGS